MLHTYTTVAELYDEQGEYELAEPFYRNALTIYEEKMGPEHPKLVTWLNHWSRYYTLARYNRAEAELTHEKSYFGKYVAS